MNISMYWAHKMAKGRYSSLYSASRGAMVSMTKALANELSEHGVRINSVSPGSTETESFLKCRKNLSKTHSDDFANDVSHKYPIERFGMPQDIGNAVYFLASEEASWITARYLMSMVASRSGNSLIIHY